MKGTVYLLHFDPGVRRDDRAHACHYIGWTQNLTVRVDAHCNGQGSPLVKAAVAQGCEITVARTWQDEDRHFERALKKQRNAPRLCPICTTKRKGKVNA